jgi:hypothetical protein
LVIHFASIGNSSIDEVEENPLVDSSINTDNTVLSLVAIGYHGLMPQHVIQRQGIEDHSTSRNGGVMDNIHNLRNRSLAYLVGPRRTIGTYILIGQIRLIKGIDHMVPDICSGNEEPSSRGIATEA